MSEDATAPEPAASPARCPRRRWLWALLGLLIFALGAVVGAAGTLLVVRVRVRHALQQPDKLPQRIAGRLRGTLDLTDEQAEQVRAILDRRYAELARIRRFAQPRVEAQLEWVRKEIADVLTPDQAARWREHFDRFRRVWIPPLPPRLKDASKASD
jgi:hypothetical protein